jgi:hypothetical protein
MEWFTGIQAKQDSSGGDCVILDLAPEMIKVCMSA